MTTPIMNVGLSNVWSQGSTALWIPLADLGAASRAFVVEMSAAALAKGKSSATSAYRPTSRCELCIFAKRKYQSSPPHSSANFSLELNKCFSRQVSKNGSSPRFDDFHRRFVVLTKSGSWNEGLTMETPDGSNPIRRNRVAGPPSD